MTTSTEGQLTALRMIERHEQGKRSVLNIGNAEECEDRGWAEAQPGGRYCLTLEGRRILEADINEVEKD